MKVARTFFYTGILIDPTLISGGKFIFGLPNRGTELWGETYFLKYRTFVVQIYTGY